jgi:hypothetical protein
MILLVGTISVNGAALDATTVNLPWTVQLLKGGEENVRNLSTAFVGLYQTPMLSYSKVGSHYIYRAHAATSAVPGNCGPNNTWNCNEWFLSNLVPGTVSQMATLQLIDTHLIGWAFSTGSTIRGATLELSNNMSYATSNYQDLIQINKFGATLIGAPSLQIVGGHYLLAATIRDSSDLYGHTLVYMHFQGGTGNTSCIDSGSGYQCDVIDQSSGFDSMGAPSFKMDSYGTPGIAYYKSNNLMYATPHAPTLLYPSNCGPGGTTWRCVSILAGDATSTVGQVVKLAFGQEWFQKAIVFTYDDEMIPVTLYHAKYVGSGGNCALDLNSSGDSIYKWKCEDVVYFYYLNPLITPSFSINMDPQGFPVMAYECATGEYEPDNLYITYPKARVGSGDTGWIVQEIDGVPAPYTEIATGAQAALSLSEAGLGLISYLQEEDYVTPDLKIALQYFKIYMPVITK